MKNVATSQYLLDVVLETSISFLTKPEEYNQIASVFILHHRRGWDRSLKGRAEGKNS